MIAGGAAEGRYVLASRRMPSWKATWRWLWLAAYFGGLVFVVRDVETIRDTALTVGVLHRPIAYVTVGLLLVPSILRGVSVPFRGVVGVVTLLGIWRLTSALWSPVPEWTLYRSLEYLVVILLTAYTATSLQGMLELRQWMNWLWSWTGALLGTIWIGLVVAPSDALIQAHREAVLPVMLQGVFPLINPNSVGTLGAVIALVAISRLAGREQWRWVIPGLFGFLTMILAQGRSAFAGFLVGTVLILALNRRLGWIGAISLLIVATSIAVSADTFLWKFFQRGQSAELFASLSGRTEFWQFAWKQYIKDNLWVGYGAFAGPRFLVLVDLGRETMSSIHSAWVETAVEIGLLGVATLGVCVAWLWIALLRCALTGDAEARSLAVEMLAVLALVTVRSIFMTGIVLHNSWYFFMAIGFVTYLRKTKQAVRASRLKGTNVRGLLPSEAVV